jgi:hypothetical protein
MPRLACDKMKLDSFLIAAIIQAIRAYDHIAWYERPILQLQYLLCVCRTSVLRLGMKLKAPSGIDCSLKGM